MCVTRWLVTSDSMISVVTRGGRLFGNDVVDALAKSWILKRNLSSNLRSPVRKYLGKGIGIIPEKLFFWKFQTNNELINWDVCEMNPILLWQSFVKFCHGDLSPSAVTFEGKCISDMFESVWIRSGCFDEQKTVANMELDNFFFFSEDIYQKHTKSPLY